MNSIFLGLKQRILLPQYLVVFITSRCNANCSFCLYKERVSSPTLQRKELSIDEIEKIASNYGELNYLAVSGGEPFLRQDVAEICECFIKKCKTRVVDIPSNLFYTENIINSVEKLCRNNPKTIIEIQLSIDNYGNRHDEIRGVENLYEQAKITAKELNILKNSYKNLHLKIATLYLPENKDQLLQVAKTINSDFLVDSRSLIYPYRMINTNNNNLIDFLEYLKAETVYQKYNESRWNWYSMAMQTIKKIHREMLKNNFRTGTVMSQYCNAGRNILVINEEGAVFPCEMLKSSIGNLRDNNYDCKNILKNEVYKEFREKYLDKTVCNCTWSCAAHAYISTNTLLLFKIVWLMMLNMLSKYKYK